MDTSKTRLLTPSQTADHFAVDPKTVVRWANGGRFPAQFDGRTVVVRTGGGHHRFDEGAVLALKSGALSWVAQPSGEAQ